MGLQFSVWYMTYTKMYADDFVPDNEITNETIRIRIRIQLDSQIDADPCGSGSTTLVELQWTSIRINFEVRAP